MNPRERSWGSSISFGPSISVLDQDVVSPLRVRRMHPLTCTEVHGKVCILEPSCPEGGQDDRGEAHRMHHWVVVVGGRMKSAARMRMDLADNRSVRVPKGVPHSA